jgi:phage tail-like protein
MLNLSSNSSTGAYIRFMPSLSAWLNASGEQFTFGKVVMDIDNKTKVREYVLHNAWVSKYQALGDLVGDANDIILESVEIQHEGFIRTDTNV